jgi:hypothetical protein
MNPLLIMKNITQLNMIRESFHSYLDSHTIVATHPEVWLHLKMDGYSPYFIADFLKNSVNIIETGRRLSKQWYEPFKDLLLYKGMNLGELSRLDNTYFFYELVSSYKALSEISRTLKPQEVILFDEGKIPCIGNNRYIGTHGIFEGVAADYCRRNNMRVKLLKPAPVMDRLLKLLRKLKTQGVVATDLFKAITSHRRSTLSTLMNQKAGRRVIAMASGSDILLMSPVLNELASNHDCQPLLIAAGPIPQGDSQRSGLGDTGDTNGVPYVPLREFVIHDRSSMRSLCKRLRTARHEIEAARQSEVFSAINPCLKYFPRLQYEYLLDSYIPRAANMIDTANKICDIAAPDILLIGDFMSLSQRVLCKVAKQRGVRTIGIPHGCINDIEEYEYETDLFFAWGEMSKQQLMAAFGGDGSEISVVGSVALEKSAQELRSHHIVEKGTRDSSGRVVVATGCFTTEVSAGLDLQAYLKAWEAIAAFAAAHPGTEIIIKPHPYADYSDWYRKYTASLGLHNFKVIDNCRLEQLFPGTEVVVLNQIISTAALVAMIAHKPVLFVRTAIPPVIGRPSDDWDERNGLRTIKRNEDIVPTLEDAVSDPEFRSRIVAGQERFLSKYVLLEGSMARTVAAIRSS